MIGLGAYALLRPWWLIVPPLIAIISRMRRQNIGMGDWTKAVDPALLAAMLKRQGGVRDARAGSAVYWAAALVALALSGPAIRHVDRSQFRNLDATLLIIDVSHEVSNAAYLRQAVAAAQLIVEQSPGRQLGLVLFGGDAYLASPLTYDAAALNALLFAIDAQTMPDAGEKPFRALEFTRRILRDAHIVSGNVILISTGRNLNAEATRQAKALAADGHLLHTLVVEAAPKSDTANPSDKTAMAILASAGGGRSGDAARLDDIAAVIKQGSVTQLGESGLQVLVWKDYGPFLLLAAIAPLLLCFRRNVR
jgi:Ca-activated chloride channel family protein